MERTKASCLRSNTNTASCSVFDRSFLVPLSGARGIQECDRRSPRDGSRDAGHKSRRRCRRRR